MSRQIYIYTEPGCTACEDAKKFLASHGILFKERDIRAHPTYLRILNEDLDSRTTPTLVSGDTLIVGFDLPEYENLARWFHSAANSGRRRAIGRQAHP